VEPQKERLVLCGPTDSTDHPNAQQDWVTSSQRAPLCVCLHRPGISASVQGRIGACAHLPGLTMQHLMGRAVWKTDFHSKGGRKFVT